MAFTRKLQSATNAYIAALVLLTAACGNGGSTTQNQPPGSTPTGSTDGSDLGSDGQGGNAPGGPGGSGDPSGSDAGSSGAGSGVMGDSGGGLATSPGQLDGGSPDNGIPEAVCGDGVKNGNEECDGEDLFGLQCTSLGYDDGSLACNPDCTRDTSACVGNAAECGDAIRNGIEQCDTGDLGEQSCHSLGYASGTLTCDGTCAFNTSACIGAALYDLNAAVGCEGVYNPDQILDFDLSGDWAGVLAEPGDGTSSAVFAFQLSCNGGTPIQVAVERKRGGGVERIGINIDINEYVAEQRVYGLKKLVFDNSVGCCEAEDASHDTMIREYLTWRMMALSGVIAGRAVFANLHANGELVGVMLNVEAVDKTFLGDRFGDDDGWLYKKSGGDGDGLKTNESCTETTCPNPYKDWFCFWRVDGPGCSEPPADVATTLPDHLMLDQLLRFGAVNAVAANSDGPIFKENNYYVYDWPGKRAYIPWDLDTTMKETNYDVFAGGNSPFVEVLFPTWEDDYAALLAQLIATSLSVAAIHGEADRLLEVAGSAIDADPHHPEPAADMVDSVKAWWQTRHASVLSQLAAH